MLVGFGLCVLRIFEGYIDWLSLLLLCFTEQIVSSRLSFDLFALAVCRGHSNWLDTLVLFR